VEQQHTIDLVDRPLGQLLMDTVERVARLEGDDVLAARLRQNLPYLGRGAAQLAEVVVPGKLQHPQRAGGVEAAPARHLVHERVLRILRAEDALGQLGWVPGVELLDRHDRQEVVHRVAQGDVGADLQPGVRRDRKGDRHREEGAIRQAHLVQDAAEIGLAHEAVERREGARCQQFQIADHARGELQGGERAGVGARLGQLLGGNSQVDEMAAIGRDQGRCCRCRSLQEKHSSRFTVPHRSWNVVSRHRDGANTNCKA
jgi:hypothetical protein